MSNKNKRSGRNEPIVPPPNTINAEKTKNGRSGQLEYDAVRAKMKNRKEHIQ